MSTSRLSSFTGRNWSDSITEICNFHHSDVWPNKLTIMCLYTRKMTIFRTNQGDLGLLFDLLSLETPLIHWLTDGF